MGQTLDVIYDGKVLKPCTSVHLKKNAHYKVQIEIKEQEKNRNAWDILENMTGSVEAPRDWASEHDYYFYGTSKNGNSEK